MKRQELVKYQQQSATDLRAEVKKLEAELAEFTMKFSLAQVKNVRQGKTIRQDIARLKTIIRSKELV